MDAGTCKRPGGNPPVWRKVKNKDGTDNRYAETNGTHNVCAVRRDGVWWFELWDVSQRPHRMLSRHRTADEARAAA